MNTCPITYEPCGDKKYSEKGLKHLSRNLTRLNDFPYTQEEQLREAAARAPKMSIQGVQPKLSAKLKVTEGIFEVTDKGGEFILKPQNTLYPQLPENEDLTMRLADKIGLEISLHGLNILKGSKADLLYKKDLTVMVKGINIQLRTLHSSQGKAVTLNMITVWRKLQE